MSLYFVLRLSALLASVHSVSDSQDDATYHENIILGAGPAGLQMGYLMQHFDPEGKRDYLILERSNVSGSWFRQYPRHNRLISVNKVYTGNDHHEFNLRHDWNSLLTPKKNKDSRFPFNINSDQYHMRFAKYSDTYYPNPRDLAQYLADFSVFFNLSIAFNTDIVAINQDPKSKLFTIDVGEYVVSQYHDNTDNSDCGGTERRPQCRRYRCKYLFVATGLSKMNLPPIRGIESATSYSAMSTDLERYKNKRIAILGGGNSAFETAQLLSTVSAHTHIFPLSMPRFAYETV